MLNSRRYCLLVDDNLLDVELTQRALSQLTADVVLRVAHTSHEMLHLLETWDYPTGPHCLLLDVNLGGESGIELVRQVKANPKWVGVPVVMLSTSCHEREVAQAYAAGANSYLVKPMDYAEFVDVMRAVVIYWLHHNVSPFTLV